MLRIFSPRIVSVSLLACAVARRSRCTGHAIPTQGQSNLRLTAPSITPPGRHLPSWLRSLPHEPGFDSDFRQAPHSAPPSIPRATHCLLPMDPIQFHAATDDGADATSTTPRGAYTSTAMSHANDLKTLRRHLMPFSSGLNFQHGYRRPHRSRGRSMPIPWR